ncbi:hypothetical protein LRHMDP2_1969 [Lacticaseibacillus rhamnosus LRHMDP2]|uniref:Uncharacterized protein n=1 Tax=Lacticaseibacillus rhamnosus LRHMDP3 TaxID=1203259 RepID=A0AB33XSN0_LACRH|nr:hypothetical protein LRHMDP3_2163 [Lacticaseibacillus rhamnosus LRHMDP3]EKS50426.1 hypothetical protein LRHMDP2_1969 [Lacticaseibacillus rhamnosus LRHMDP2]
MTKKTSITKLSESRSKNVASISIKVNANINQSLFLISFTARLIA